MSEETAAREAADELYAGPPGEFVARRDELARQARAAGDRGLATAIKALRRPSVGAWYLNSASRAGLASLRELLAFGERLRAAQSAGDFGTIRELAPRRGSLVNEVVRDLTALLSQHGTAATPAGIDEVRATLASALADPEVAVLVEQGRLDRPHSYGGFGELMQPVAVRADAPRSPGTAEATPAPPDDAAGRPAAREAEAEQARAAEDARRELQAAEAGLEAATARRTEVEGDVRGLRSRVEALAAELAAARHDLTVAEAELGDAVDDEQAAGRRVEEARRGVPRPASG